MKKIDSAKIFKDLGQWFKSIPQMDKKVRALSIIKIICFALTFPALFVATMVVCAQVGEGLSFYTFWPYLAAIIVALLGTIFGVIAFWLYTKKQKTKRTVMQRTAILLVVCIALTAGIGLLLDIALPDALAKATFGTLFVEDMYHRGVEESGVVKDYIHLYIGLNLLNGNYDGKLAYENVKKDTTTIANANAIAKDEVLKAYAKEQDAKPFDVFENYWFDEYNKTAKKADRYTDLDKELYDFIYEHYVLMDYDYALKNSVERKAFCLSLVNVYSDTYAKLCKEGFKTNSLGAIGCTGNEKLTAIYGQNYATQDMDGYIPINEDSGIAYVTNGRMTVPLIVRMLLNDSYHYTQPIYGEDGKTVVGYDGFMAYLYRPAIVEEYVKNGGTFENGKSKDLYLASDGNHYYLYETGHVDAVINWCILDLLGEPMPLAEIDLAPILSGFLPAGMNEEMLSTVLSGILDSQGANIEELLVDGFTNRVIVTATNGQKLYLNLYITDEGALAATLYPQGMKDGYIGYQYMAWLEMGNLLAAVCGLVSLRNLLYFFAAISMVMILTIGVIDKLLEERRAALKLLAVADGAEKDELVEGTSEESVEEQEEAVDGDVEESVDGDVEESVVEELSEEQTAVDKEPVAPEMA